MTLREPAWLLLLLPLAGLAAAYLAVERRRRHDAARFAAPELLGRIASPVPVRHRHLAAGAVGAALVALTVGMAGPTHDVRVPKKQAVLMLAVDTSASMAATDVAPNRLAAAVRTAKDFVAKTPAGFQVGLVSFSDTAQVLVTPTRDHGVVEQALDGLSLGHGTAAGDALDVALQAITAALQANHVSGGAARSASIVLLSDGTTTVGRPVEVAAQDARDQGVPVQTIAFGTPNGTVVVQGRLIPVPADTQAMQSVADVTGGHAFQAASAGQLSSVFDAIQSRVGYTTEPRSLGVPFLSGGVLALLVAGTVSLVSRERLL